MKIILKKSKTSKKFGVVFPKGVPLNYSESLGCVEHPTTPNVWIAVKPKEYNVIRYFDVHVFIKRNEGYSFGVKMIVPSDTIDVQDDDVIKFAEEKKLFTEEGDGEMVDTIDEMDETEFNNVYDTDYSLTLKK